MAEFMAPSDTIATKGSSVFATTDDRLNTKVHWSGQVQTISVSISINRICYHSATSMPIHVNELDEDSEEELDPEWMRIKMQMVINYYQRVIN